MLFPFEQLDKLRIPILAALLAAACGGDGLTDVDAPAITGRWTAESDVLRWQMDLADPGTGVVSGNYLLTFIEGGGSVALAGPVTGRYDFPAVSLDLVVSVPPESSSCAIRGTMAVSGQSILGTATCEGDSDPLDLRRAP